MTNPFHNISDPKQLLALVQEGVECERCHGIGEGWNAPWAGAPYNCPPCNGTGHTPLPSLDLEALAACWCEGEWVMARVGVWKLCSPSGDWFPLDHYTTSPDAAMRLQEKYRLSLHPCVDSFDNVAWQAFSMEHTETIHSKIDGRKSKCQVLTECALIAALTEAIEGASDAGD